MLGRSKHVLKIGKKRHGTTEPGYAAPESYRPYFESNLSVGIPPFLEKCETGEKSPACQGKQPLNTLTHYVLQATGMIFF